MSLFWPWRCTVTAGSVSLASSIKCKGSPRHMSPRASSGITNNISTDALTPRAPTGSMLNNISSSSSHDGINALRAVHNNASFRASSIDKHAMCSSSSNQAAVIKVKDKRFSFRIEDEDPESKLTCVICASRNRKYCSHRDQNGGKLVFRANKVLQRWSQAASSWISGTRMREPIQNHDECMHVCTRHCVYKHACMRLQEEKWNREPASPILRGFDMVTVTVTLMMRSRSRTHCHGHNAVTNQAAALWLLK